MAVAAKTNRLQPVLRSDYGVRTMPRRSGGKMEDDGPCQGL